MNAALPAVPQFGLINLLKVVAAQLIVLHHLAFYGPMADHVRPMLPALVDWLASSARIAVQVFLVVAGFLAARSLSPDGHDGHSDPLGALWRRYAKLAPPFVAATLIAAIASSWAGAWMTHDSISDGFTIEQLLAHGLLLHGVLDYPSISAGAWYVAIDFQLYALTVGLLWLAGHVADRERRPLLAPLLVALGMTASLLVFNLDAELDDWALYFFGSYGMGLMAWWASDRRRRPLVVMLLVLLTVVPALVALALDFRSRIALALIVACALFLFGRMKVKASGRVGSAIDALARSSYSMFLIHFPVSLLINAGFTRFAPPDPLWQGGGMLLAWSASIAAGLAFHRWVEVPLGQAMHGISARRARA